MPTNPMSEVVQHLRRTVLVRDGAGMTDGQLLECFLRGREEAALAVLVRRHGPMVWGVCRRLLGNYHDAEDAFQATFLVLVRKASSIAPRERVVNWLYGVAHQTALKARATAMKQRARERQVKEMPEPEAVRRGLPSDLRPWLDEELIRLPDPYRVVLLLCDLEGKTRKEAARHLGVPEGTVASRLARARTMLAKRLTRHSPAVTGGALTGILAESAASACVPASVVSGTIQAASLVAAGQGGTGVISVPVAALMEGVLKAMLMTKIKIATILLLAVGVLAAGMGASIFSRRTQAAEPTAQQEAKPREERPSPPVANKERADSDQGKIQGTWHLEKAEINGVELPLFFRPKEGLIAVFAGNKGTANFMDMEENGVRLSRIFLWW